MSDLIDRYMAIDAFGLSEKTRKYGGDHSGYDTRMLYEIQDVLEGLPSAQPEPQWIPCSERLPEEKDAGILKKLGTNKMSDYVIATVEVKGERMTVTACTYNGEWDWNMKYAFPDYKIIAWMPLPEPYTERREG